MGLFSLAAFAYVINVPLGIWRTRLRKFSFMWLIAIHLSVPLIVYLRYLMHIKFYLFPVTLTTAILGQYTGMRMASAHLDPGTGSAGPIVDRVLENE